MPHCRVVSAPKNGAFFTPGDRAGAYVLVRGRVSILTRPNPGTEIELFARVPYELFGEASLLLGRQINEARAAAPSVAIRIDGDVLRAVLAERTPATYSFARLLAERMALAEARLSEVAGRSVKERLRILLERLAADARVRDCDGCHLPQEMTRDQLARMVGASREAVSRGLSRLQREGSLILRGRRIIVPSNRSSPQRAD